MLGGGALLQERESLLMAFEVHSLTLLRVASLHPVSQQAAWCSSYNSRKLGATWMPPCLRCQDGFTEYTFKPLVNKISN